MVGYRGPKNLRDLLVKANVPLREGDDKALPQGMKPHNRVEDILPLPLIPEHTAPSVQKRVLDFFLPLSKNSAVVHKVSKESTIQQAAGVSYPTKVGGTPSNKRGFNFCNTRNCRYCPNLDKTGPSSVTKKEYRAMKNVSCRSSNLI
jgi:hypothetical protein